MVGIFVYAEAIKNTCTHKTILLNKNTIQIVAKYLEHMEQIK